MYSKVSDSIFYSLFCVSNYKLLYLHYVGDSDMPAHAGLFFIIYKGWKCQAGRELFAPNESDYISTTTPTYRKKEEKGKPEDKKGVSSLGQKKVLAQLLTPASPTSSSKLPPEHSCFC